ncbi:YggS family pyridoxal phosphate-dependent enzyme [Candidatus Izimaplasma bacterium ZiA1]|uniref:YggS family pyridoxal phosphate-dependent enzyme n=1 Tax=Candidatus Izimoplasma sp. ZiA1 TaxID=2024899 RepID=UPI000BAA8288|nr:YggS family pyridoxal phosphate-dependent enzyme [Candidatus Izimaplasma bacterium ZiA1]
MKQNIQSIKAKIKDYKDVHIVAATKYIDDIKMRELFSYGINEFGENRVEAFVEKYENLKDLPIIWHFIGTLQTKKVKKLINSIDYLHSLDNLKLAEEINKRRTSPLKVFLQVNISNEENKHGLEVNEVKDFIIALKPFQNIQIIGFMGMAELTDDKEIIKNEFQKLTNLKKSIKADLDLNINELSIGMSNDYLVALECEGTYLRLGSVLLKNEVK